MRKERASAKVGHPHSMGGGYLGEAMRTSNTSWLASSMGWLSARGDGLAGPQVLGGLGAVQAELGQVQVEGVGGVAVAAGVDDGDG